MGYRVAIFVIFFSAFLIMGSCEKQEELAPAEPAPAEVLSKPGEEEPESRQELIEKREYKEEMKERAENKDNL